MKKSISFFFLCLVLVVACKHMPPLIPTDPTNPPVGGGPCDPDTVYFQNDILPIFQTNCAKSACHNAASHIEGIILTDYNNIVSTGEIVGGRPNSGKIYESIISSSSSDIMPPPPDAPLTADQIAKILKWINQGAKNNYCDAGCDTVNVKYSTQVKSLLSSKCTGCHNTASCLHRPLNHWHSRRPTLRRAIGSRQDPALPTQNRPFQAGILSWDSTS